jgi:hypothetical protein
MGRPRLFDTGDARFLLRLKADTFDDLDALAEKREVSLNALLHDALTAFLESTPEREELARERTRFRRRRSLGRAKNKRWPKNRSSAKD